MAKARKKGAPKLSQVDSKAAAGTLEGGKTRPENWADKKDSEAYKEAAKFYSLIQKEYDNQYERDRHISEYWAIYSATPDSNRTYLGNSQCYLPAVRDAVNARAKRTIKQLFPNRYKHVEAVGAGGDTPFPQLALLEHYIRKTDLKSIVRSDLVAGDVTGTWNLYIDWTKSYRRVTELVKRNPLVGEAVEGESVSLTDPTDEEEATESRDIMEEGPDIVDFATEDLAVVPPTVNSLEKADVVSIRLRMSRDKVQQMLDEGVFKLPGGASSIDKFVNQGAGDSDHGMRTKSPPKQRSNDAGVRTEGTFTYALVYEATAMLPFEDGIKQLAYIYYAGPNDIVGIIKAPQWGGKRPTICAPVERIQGSFTGISKIEPVKFLQWNLNDFWNMGQDSAMYSLLPIVMTDPLKNPNYATMVIGLAAVWGADPNSTKFANFPQIYKDAALLCDTIKRQIWESMDVNEMMMGKMPQGRKNNQLMGAMQQEQMVAIMDHAERYEDAMLNPLVERMFEYDQQFRTKTLTVMTMGEIGVKAKMTDIEPQQWGERFDFRWAGTSFIMGMQRQQQKIAAMNVLRGVPPQQMNGRKLDITPILEDMVNDVFGPEVAPRILVDERNLFTVDPATENELMHNGMPAQVHEADNDVEHIQSHQSVARITGDAQGKFRSHLAAHIIQLNKKREMAMAQQAPGVPGAPGPSVGGPARPGVAGTPVSGGQPSGPRPVQGPPGMERPDNIADAGVPGRG